jgi:hypothetical protein
MAAVKVLSKVDIFFGLFFIGSDDYLISLLLCSKDLPASAILELFGNFFFEFCVESGFDKILTVLGSTTKDFLENLDALHDHLSTIYPGTRYNTTRFITVSGVGCI